jgi:hypothetical protein
LILLNLGLSLVSGYYYLTGFPGWMQLVPRIGAQVCTQKGAIENAERDSRLYKEVK